MINLTLFTLALTLAAEAPTEPSAEAPVASPDATAPAPTEPATPPTETAPVEKPAATVVPNPTPGEPEATVASAPKVKDPTEEWYSPSYPSRLRILAVPVARTVPKESFELVIDHRSSSPIYNKDSDHPFADMGNTFGGFDSPLTVGLGLRYGIIDRLDAGLYRVGGLEFDTYELDAGASLLRQEDNQIDLMVRGGVSWFVVPNHDDALWPFAQLFASRLFANRLLVTAGVMYHSNSSSSTVGKYHTPKYRDEKHKWSVAGAAGAELRLADWVALDAETVACTAGFCTKKPAFSGGVKFITFRHTFALVCGNTQYLTADGYITNTDTPWSKLVLGFNITREY